MSCERTLPTVGEGSRSIDGAIQSKFWVHKEVICARTVALETRGTVATGKFAYRYDAVSRKHSSPGNPNGLLISVPTVLPHVTLQITSPIAFNLACLWRAYTQRRLIGTIHYMRAGLFQTTGHSWWWMWMKAKGETERETFRVWEQIK